MSNHYKEKTKLALKNLQADIDMSLFDFETTGEVPDLKSIVGQKRGLNVMQFGLKMKAEGYHLYVSGIPGTGKTSFTYSMVEEVAAKKVTLYDWCYVYNFKAESYRPRVLQLPQGRGKALSNDMIRFLEDLAQELPRVFQEEKYLKDRNNIIKAFQKQTNEEIEVLRQFALSHDFDLKQSSSGMASVPMKEGRVLEKSQYEQLSDEEKKYYEENSKLIQEKIMHFTEVYRKMENKLNKKLEDFDRQVALTVINKYLINLEEKHYDCSMILEYLKEVREDIVENIRDFLPKSEAQQMEEAKRPRTMHATTKYKVNVIVDNSHTKGAPVVTADHPSYYNLLGKIEYTNQMGMMMTDFTKIKPGFLHQANGGYIIIQVKDILMNNYAWQGLKRALKQGKIQIESLGEQAGAVAVSSIRPDPMPLDIKVILIGDPRLYQLLYQNDEDFQKLFKIKADFDVEMAANTDNIKGMVSFIHSFSETNNLRHMTKAGVAQIIKYSIRLTSNQKKLSTRFNQIVEILYEANAWAAEDESDFIEAKHIEKALIENEYRHNLYEEKVEEQIDEASILIDTDGAVVGQVNGLAVYSSAQYSFGKPSRITATTYMGEKGIINIERESNMSGSIHNKGVYILGGFLGEKFAQDFPLALNCHIAFEQSYGGVDGDSASSTELYAILSSLSGVPLNQGIAVTGSVNQKGQIQPIGGANEKIEGFFKVCRNRGLTGKQGVIIPYQNVKNLTLKKEVIEAIEAGQFTIYAIETIEEGIGILTDETVVGNTDRGQYEKHSIYGKVYHKLKVYYDKVKDQK